MIRKGYDSQLMDGESKRKILHDFENLKTDRKYIIFEKLESNHLNNLFEVHLNIKLY